jgi:antitoxin component YwqK of YwqJK toxin-antitoxin module
MIKSFFLILLILIVVFSGNLFSQKADTIYHKKFYNYIQYYPSESARMSERESINENKILFLGNKKDTVKDGSWIYFYPNGNILAKGNYKNGLKKGKWKYYISDVKREIIFSKKSNVIDKINFDDSGWPKIIDIVKTKEGYYTLENGQQKFPAHFLD